MNRVIRVLFRVDASVQIGSGHVVRCLTLAARLKKRGVNACFVCRQLEGDLRCMIEARGFEVHCLPKPKNGPHTSEAGPKHASWLGVPWQEDAEQTGNIIDALDGLDWVIVDHYALDAQWERNICAKGVKVFVIDDLADRTHDCSLLLDQNMVAAMADRYVGLVPKNSTLLLGPSYALLHDDYARLRPRTPPREGRAHRLLISFGGMDRECLTEKTVEALLDLNLTQIEVDIILSSSSPQFRRIAELVSNNQKLRLHDHVPSLASFMVAADLAIGSSGTTNWERLCLGLPALIFTVADNQRPVAEALAAQNLVHWVGDAGSTDQRQIQHALAVILAAKLDTTYSERAMSVVDGDGAERVCAVLLSGPGMQFAVRHAVLRDEALLFDWANDSLTRLNAFNSTKILLDEHRSWFRGRLRKPDDCSIYIIETFSNLPLGQVRFDRNEGGWEISYSLAPAFRGKGIGQDMLGAAISTFRQCHGNAVLFGQVKADNTASRKIFEELGFIGRKSDEARIVFEHSPGSEGCHEDWKP